MRRSKPRPDSMTLIEHLTELRTRLIRATIALSITTLISVFFTPKLLEWLTLPMGNRHPVALHATETIIVYFKVALISGLVLAMPVIIYELLMFVIPGLTPKEKKFVLVIVPAASVLYALGVAFAGFIMIPFAVKYLQSFLASMITPTYSIDKYISFVTTILFWTGVIFETPLIMAFLARMGVISPKQLSGGRRYAIVLIAIVAAVITPTPDPVNMSIVMVPLLLLYELGVILARITYRPREHERTVKFLNEEASHG